MCILKAKVLYQCCMVLVTFDGSKTTEDFLTDLSRV